MSDRRYKLSLHVTPNSSGRALSHVYEALSMLTYTDYELNLVDELKQPAGSRRSSEETGAVLVWHSPDGDVSINDLTNVQKVRDALKLSPP